jgi:HTH-type transcriptional regulator/antitoxin HigA
MGKKSNPRIGTSLDDFLKEEGLFEELGAQATKEVIAWRSAGRDLGSKTSQTRAIRAASVKYESDYSLRILWTNGRSMRVDLRERVFRLRGMRSIRNKEMFARARRGEGGHSIVWPGNMDMGADRLWEIANKLVDEIGDRETHPLMGLLDIVSFFVRDYEERNIDIPDAEPAAVLRFFMEQHNLRQADLAEIFGSQSNVSEVLNGKREINARQARALADRFSVSAAVFI